MKKNQEKSENGKRRDKKAPSKPKSALKIALLAFLISVGIVLGIIGGIVYSWYRTLPDISILEKHEPSFTTQIYDCKGRVLANLFEENRIWVPLEKIPKYLIYAVLAAEDSDFYYHHGINIKGIIRAAWVNFRSGKIVEGGSTITQQLAKNLFLTPSKTIKRKIKEMMLALQIENRYNKDRILELYLNEIYLGHGAYGVQAAAKTYFDKNVWDLNLAESALIAALIKAPEKYSPYRNLKRALARQRYVIKRMEKLGYISHKEAEEALRQPLIFRGVKEIREWKAPYFVAYVLKKLLKEYGAKQVYRGGLKVYTTLDLDLQKYAEEAFSKAPSEGALIAIDPKNGYIKAMVGGKNFKKSQFNRAVQAHRQPGSAFKAFVYTAAFEAGFTESTLVEDSPIEFPNGWKPKNYDNKYHGWVTIREAFEHSYNIVAVRVAQEVKPAKIIECAKRMGIKSPLPNDLSIALGSADVTPLEMAVGYACIANEGYRIKPIAILEIRDRDGKLLEKNLPSRERVLRRDIAYLMIDMMKHVMKRGTGVRARLNRPCAGKTGTTNNFSDAWFIGFTPDLVAAVYLGNDDHTPLGKKGATGGRLAAPIWKSFMEKALKNVPPHDFPIPDDIIFVKVCAQSGKLPTPACPKIVEEAFIKGTEPTETCDIHGIQQKEELQREEPTYIPPVKKSLPQEKEKETLKEEEMEEIQRKFEELLKKYGIKK